MAVNDFVASLGGDFGGKGVCVRFVCVGMKMFVMASLLKVL